MGIYLGQLPPAEFARLKAELAETLIANFCYPRFFDSRTETLRTRPVDRAKRQEVWLYLSSFDFTSWGRVDLMAPEFQSYVERLFIQFVQRNRSFFGTQGRRRMSDVRDLIGTASTSVVTGLRGHLRGQKLGRAPFGSPRPPISWRGQNVNGVPDLTWEQVSTSTLLLQQQLQELRGEIKAPATLNGKANTQAPTPQSSRSQPLEAASSALSYDEIPQTPTITTPTAGGNGNRPAAEPTALPASKSSAGLSPAASVEVPASSRQAKSLPSSSEHSAAPLRKSGPLSPPPPPRRKSEPLHAPVNLTSSSSVASFTRPATSVSTLHPSVSVPNRGLSQSSLPASATVTPGQREMMSIGEDDIAIFEQMRQQLLVWLRIEAIRAGLDITGQSPSQLMETLRQQARVDETRLQVVSTLINLANQVIKTGVVSILDYKQALMFHLMHTRT